MSTRRRIVARADRAQAQRAGAAVLNYARAERARLQFERAAADAATYFALGGCDAAVRRAEFAYRRWIAIVDDPKDAA